MDAATRKTLKSLARTRTPAEMKALFKAIRAESDAALLGSIAPREKPGKTRARPDFAAAIADRLAVIHGPARDKADALIGAIEEQHGPIDITADGLRPVIRRLAKMVGEKAVAAATDRLMKAIESRGTMRETVK
jgi:hypothetical protein